MASTARAGRLKRPAVSVTVPVLVKYYVLTDILSIDAGPQFAFLVDDNIDTPFSKSQSFDFAVVGGLGLDIGKSLFAQAH